MAFGAPAKKGEVANFIQLVRVQDVVPPVPGEKASLFVGQAR
jgi:hypothetical protein